MNIDSNTLSSSPPTLDNVIKPFSPLVVDMDVQEPKCEKILGVANSGRPRVGSTARRTALGWSKRSIGKSSTDHKENLVGKENSGNGNLMT